jgi:hypothetical protein
MEQPRDQRGSWWRYLLIGILLWTVVDFGTAGGFDPAYFRTYGFALLIFYIGYPLLFTALIYRLHVPEKFLMIPTVLCMFLIEAVFTGNPLIIGFPACLAGIPLAVAVYAPLTYFPLWIVRGEMGRHKGIVIFLSAVEIVIMLLTTFGSGK